MTAFLYRCPRTGLSVQGFAADMARKPGEEAYEPVTCPACAGVHLINPENGRVLGADHE